MKDYPITLAAPQKLIIAGWTGRNPSDIAHHIEELAAIGVPGPSATPLFYRVSASLLTQDEMIEVLGPHTTGEAEPVILWADDGPYVGIGSDHTDRQAETIGVALSKQVAPKVLGRMFWRLDDIALRWDSLVLRSYRWVGGQKILYQEGTLASMRPPTDLLPRYQAQDGALQKGAVMFCGTVPVIGPLCSAEMFEIVLSDPQSGKSLSHLYRIRELPVIA
ncbi:DUF2848 domain-containing protein [Acetobacter sp. TBRC 12305]|uniref:DUF2848 domain-containing protein n=1 Tax=Acetobacter garciniae TaxID=2817435 RepID=A0A939HP88_9PROT|nr:DUF2848 domain-containing protein [Acetobacter garciniae]MBO1325413.1 DUF2848 domain-containing protein [Acetobacter garciniae]MBX0345415.1 DUF2848 domain-containing protein [Acetobacter garciniae]